MIKSASYSRLLDFEQCRYRVKMKFIDKVPDEQGEHAARGERIHTLAENWVKGKGKTLPAELAHFKDEFHTMRRLFKEGAVSLEGEWGFDKDWVPTDWKTAQLRMKLDSCVYTSKKTAIVIDYKTGRRFGNEVKHGEQGQLYAIGTFMRDPLLEDIEVELWYLDKDELHNTHYSRIEALRYVQSFDERINKMLTAKEFPPNPNAFTCKWCPYGPNKGGQCPHGVSTNRTQITQYRQQFG